MTIQDAKQIKLADYLQSLGYTPVKQQGRSLWYKSPLRNETDASFKVNTELNQWYDFGIGKGGNIIALAAELYHSENVAYLLERIAERPPYIRPFLLVSRKHITAAFKVYRLASYLLLPSSTICEDEA